MQPAPGHRSKEKVVELPSELDEGAPDDVALDVRSPDATDVSQGNPPPPPPAP